MGGCEGCGVDDSPASTLGSVLTVSATWPFATGPWGSDMVSSYDKRFSPFRGIQLVLGNICDNRLLDSRERAVW